MKRVSLAVIASAAMLLLPSELRGEDATSDNEITALGRLPGNAGWLSTMGPDQDGRYAVRIDIADLDPVTESGWARMRLRVHTGTARLCDKTGALPLAGGRYNTAQRKCWQETRSQALTQMYQARNAALGGRRVSGLGFGMQALRR